VQQGLRQSAGGQSSNTSWAATKQRKAGRQLISSSSSASLTMQFDLQHFAQRISSLVRHNLLTGHVKWPTPLHSCISSALLWVQPTA